MFHSGQLVSRMRFVLYEDVLQTSFVVWNSLNDSASL